MKRILIILCITAFNIATYAQNTFPASGNVGIGTENPRSALDVAKYIPNGDLGAILGRLSEGDATGSGTFIGVRGGSTQPGDIKSFSIIHNFYGETNSAINFFRGGSVTGGFLTFNTGADTEKLRITANGDVGIGTTTPHEKLSVNGKIRAHEIKVEVTGWPDYVFDEGYKKTSLADLEQYLKINKHLPNMPTAASAANEGVELGELGKQLLKNQEELTLHLIEQDKKITELLKIISAQQTEIEKLKIKQK